MKPKRTKYSDSLIEKIVDYIYNKGHSFGEAVEEFDLPESTITYLTWKYRKTTDDKIYIHGPHTKYTDNLIDDVGDYIYIGVKTKREAMNKFGKTNKVIITIIKKYRDKYSNDPVKIPHIESYHSKILKRVNSEKNREVSKSNIALVETYNQGVRCDEEGNLLSPDNTPRRLREDKDGYLIFSNNVSFGSYPVKLHRLQAYQKYGDKLFEDGIMTRHLDGNPKNNNINNIDIGDNYQNQQDIPEDIRKKRSVRGLIEAKKANTKYTDEFKREVAEYMYIECHTSREAEKKFNLPFFTLQRLARDADLKFNIGRNENYNKIIKNIHKRKK
jgi:transposase